MASRPAAPDLDRARRARELFERALELDRTARSAFVAEACGPDLQLHGEVQALLRLLSEIDTQDVFPPLPHDVLQPLRAAVDMAGQVHSSASPDETARGPELQRGDRVGRYRILERVGGGGMGTVYAAYDTALERRVALKFLLASPSDKAAARLLAEASAMARLSHPNVVTVHDIGTLERRLFVAMEHVTGVTLTDWRRERSRSLREIMTVMAGVARGLAAAHAAGIIHRDVKPGNILVDGARVLVTDFGLSTRDGVASGGLVAGTPGYMPPEQLRGEPATAAADVFGFCATLFEMLYLEPPFGTGSLAEIHARIEAEQWIARRPNVRVPKRIARLLRAGLASDASKRPTSMAAIATTLLADPARFVRRVSLVAVAAAIIVVALWTGHRRPSEPDRPANPSSSPQMISGPSWVRPPRAIPATMFGVTVQSATGAMPSFRVGALRFWDCGTTWASIETRRGDFSWETLDRLVNAANRTRLPALFVIGGTPAWAAPDGVRSVYEDGSRASPPDQMADWQNFIAAVAGRYGDRIEAYELWVLGNDPRFYAGPVERLVEMTRAAYRTIKSAAPRAIVVCPGMGRLWTAEGQQTMRRFAELGGYQHCDVASIKLYQRIASDAPESMLELVTTVDRILHAAGIHPPLWNTGTMYEIPLQGSLDEARAVNHAVRFFLVGLYAQVQRMYFYNWGGTKIPIVLQAVGGAPTAAAIAVQQLEHWLENASIRSCGKGPTIGLPENVWQCEFTITGARVFDAAIRWTHQGSQVTTAPRNSAAVQHLDGTRSPIRMGDPIVVTERPIFIEYRPSISE